MYHFLTKYDKMSILFNYSIKIFIRPLDRMKIQFSYFSTKTYVVGTQKNHLNKIFTIFCSNISESKLFDTSIVFFKEFFFEKVNLENKSADDN